jgi:hypothetical protein
VLSKWKHLEWKTNMQAAVGNKDSDFWQQMPDTHLLYSWLLKYTNASATDPYLPGLRTYHPTNWFLCTSCCKWARWTRVLQASQSTDVPLSTTNVRASRTRPAETFCEVGNQLSASLSKIMNPLHNTISCKACGGTFEFAPVCVDTSQNQCLCIFITICFILLRCHSFFMLCQF